MSKVTFEMYSAANGGVIVHVSKEEKGRFPELPEAFTDMIDKISGNDPLIKPERADKYEMEPGLYMFNHYTKNGEKKNPVTQALEFIELTIEEFGLGEIKP